uniref:Uncharacterized protein n=1 Tax=Haplochromis burtoni TaxID=8153 RepID=A0A3Q2WKC1_HAPBU
MPGVLGAIARRAAPVLRGHVVAQRASIYTRPAKDKIGSFVSLIYRGILTFVGHQIYTVIQAVH